VRGARCIAITTGLRVGRGAERGGSLILPPTDAAQARRVGADVLGSAEPLTVTLTRHPRAALRRRLTRVLVAAVILTGLAGWVSVLRSDPSVVVATAVVCAVLGVPLAVDRYRSLGHAVIAGRVVFAQGSLVRRRAALNADGVIGFTLRQSIFQRPGHLVTLTATTAAGRQRYELLDVRDTDAVAIADRVLPGVLTPFLVRG
jgi:putative membrane protein